MDNAPTPMDVDDHKDVDEHNDEIVKEIPVYLSSQLLNHLYLFQYPVRSKPFTPESQPIAARIKPTAQMVELDLPLQTNAYTYDKLRGEEYGFAMSDEQMKTVYDTDHMQQQQQQQQQKTHTLLDKQTLRSSFIPAKTNYMVAVIREDELHLTPIAGTVQLRPSLDYLDQIDQKQRAANRKVHEEELKASGAADTKKAVPQQLQLARLETEEMIAARKKSIIYQRKQVEEEPWVKLGYFDETSEEADIVFQRMFCLNRDELRYTSTLASYLEDISPPTVLDVKLPDKDGEQPDVRPGVLSRQDLKLFDLGTQLRALLMNAFILPFERLATVLPNEVTTPEILQHLTSIAVPLHGNWVVKSSLLYRGRRQHARDYLIKLFADDTQHDPPRVSRAEFDRVARLPVEDTLKILQEFAVLQRQAGPALSPPYWQLKYPASRDFVILHEDVVQQTWSGFVKGDLQRSLFTQIDEAIVALLRTQGVMKADAITAAVSSKVTDANDNAIAARREYLCHTIHDAYVLKNTNSKYEDIRDIVLDLFRKAADGTVKKLDILKQVKNKLERDMPVKAFNDITAELSASPKSPYVWKTLTK
ncbi:hypothetical protein RI367_000617 [Sorochytrium milnesiophthora]